MLWNNEKDILNLIFGNVIVNEKTMSSLPEGYKIVSSGYRMFFLEVIAVPPNRFRPENKLAGFF
jgi:5-deoxy-D-glucuronate isomerase